MRMMDTVETMFTALHRDVPDRTGRREECARQRKPMTSAPESARARMVFMAERFGVGERQMEIEIAKREGLLDACSGCGAIDRCERYRAGMLTEFSAQDCPNGSLFAKIAI